MSEKFIWIVVTKRDTTEQYLGQLRVTGECTITIEGAVEECKHYLSSMIDTGSVIELSPCYRFVDALTPRKTHEGIEYSRNLLAIPMGAELDTDRSHLYLCINSYQIITGRMAEADVAAYMDLVKSAKAIAEGQRAHRSGISVPGRDPNTRMQ